MQVACRIILLLLPMRYGIVIGMAIGRPPIFKTPEELSIKIDEFLEYCQQKQEPITKIGFTCWAKIYHDLFAEYANKPGFSDAIKKIESESQAYLVNNGLQNKINPTMCIFLLKANHGLIDYVDTRNQNHNVNETMAEYKASLDAERDAAIKEKNAAESQK